MRLPLQLVFAALIVCCFSTSNASDKTVVYINLVEQAKFDVLYHRVNTNQSGAIIGGLIGAGIQSSIESDKDSKKIEELEPLIEPASWQTYFIATLNDKLASKNFQIEWVNDENMMGDGFNIKMYKPKYGYKVIDLSSRQLSAFVDFNVILTKTGVDISEKKKKKKKNFYLTNKAERSFNTLIDEQSIANEDLQSTLRKAARRLANKIIYYKEV